MQANVLKRSAVAVAIAGAFALGGVAADRVLPSAAFAAVVPTVNPAAPTVAVNGAPVVALPDFSGLVEQYGPAVVNISVTSDNRKVLGQDENDDTPDLQGLPPNFASSSITSRCRGSGPTRGVGSGFIIDPRRHRADQCARRRRRR